MKLETLALLSSIMFLVFSVCRAVAAPVPPEQPVVSEPNVPDGPPGEYVMKTAAEHAESARQKKLRRCRLQDTQICDD